VLQPDVKTEAGMGANRVERPGLVFLENSDDSLDGAGCIGWDVVREPQEIAQVGHGLSGGICVCERAVLEDGQCLCESWCAPVHACAFA
jgi:hypothetical protein